MPKVEIIGAGLAGCECAFQLAERGHDVQLWEMRPHRPTPAHQTDRFAELVCSNSLRSDDPLHAAGLLKREMESLGSLVLAAARETAVPAGAALAVDRERFAEHITGTIESHPRIQVERREMCCLPAGPAVIASGPLTSEGLTAALVELLGEESLFFFDSISPIVEAESLDRDRLFAASRWDKGDGDDYLNSGLDREQYLEFRRRLLEAEVVTPRDFEAGLFFEGCLPIEELARRGEDTMRYGPLKPVGLRGPGGERYYAVAQLRQENLARSQYSLVGFQSRLRWPDQRQVWRSLPGLEDARFVRLGQVHRNTFINAPRHLDLHYRLRPAPALRLAGQLTGVEGYLESAATGLVAGLYLALELRDGEAPPPLPFETALGALARHLTLADPKHFRPANINYGLFPDLAARTPRKQRRAAYASRAHEALQGWRLETHPEAAPTATAPVP